MKDFSKKALALFIAMITALTFVPCVFAGAVQAKSELSGPLHKHLEDNAILGYKYNSDQDYYYCDSPNSWQKAFGYTRIYDLIAPYVLLEYDYARVHFTYEDIDWMIQFWKGQYGLIFYGSEVGVYYKDHDGKEDTYATHYECAGEGDWPMIQTTMFHDENGDGNYVESLHTPYEKTWWSTGFKRGHLRQEEPATELRQQGIITFKSKEMAEAFADAFEDCGFTRVYSTADIALDCFAVDGESVRYVWQNNSEAENTMPIKIAAGTFIIANFGLFMTGLLALLAGMMGMGLLALIIL
ncbi:MAG: DUF4474 domain-containing protein [Clostridia bacterium]|nr:DUF4474 domain-containing protein [Clostridia bacterium]